MPLHATDGEFIDLETAKADTARYRAEPGAMAFKAQFFGKDNIQAIFNEDPDCLGVRIYNSVDADGNKGFILVGAVADESDLYEGKLLANGPDCPTCCAANSPLNE
ncbi:hypothetical protein SAMN02745146_2128 [Hymenobacter daecheongensis DSM 21074]|uniref:Uncharacterized protein n=1 Tax=Hymenobacter daecheongensis DSM 21074 TaxID=1121955 RepID=A0A1M6G5I0_9BACT|nr:hypothetical protein [Hymenobacter daecheongensis]SHJ05268.1 hypothetical protein SAMN02745146_2128 [Hymenobacter daecheongensis DSM 21074]